MIYAFYLELLSHLDLKFHFSSWALRFGLLCFVRYLWLTLFCFRSILAFRLCQIKLVRTNIGWRSWVFNRCLVTQFRAGSIYPQEREFACFTAALLWRFWSWQFVELWSPGMIRFLILPRKQSIQYCRENLRYLFPWVFLLPFLIRNHLAVSLSR